MSGWKDKAFGGDGIDSEHVEVPTGGSGPMNVDWKEKAFGGNGGDTEPVEVPTGTDVEGDSGLEQDPAKPDTGE